LNPPWTEGELEFDFSSAKVADKLDAAAKPLKSADFWVLCSSQSWLIEVKDPDETPPQYHAGQVLGILKEIKNDHFLREHVLPKLYGSYAHLCETGKEPRGIVHYCVVIGLTTLTAADRSMLANRAQRIIDRIGPKVRYSRHWPVVEVHNLASWNSAHPDMAVTRNP